MAWIDVKYTFLDFKASSMDRVEGFSLGVGSYGGQGIFPMCGSLRCGSPGPPDPWSSSTWSAGLWSAGHPVLLVICSPWPFWYRQAENYCWAHLRGVLQAARKVAALHILLALKQAA